MNNDKLNEIAEKWRKQFVGACPPFVPEAQRQAYEILLDSYFKCIMQEAYKVAMTEAADTAYKYIIEYDGNAEDLPNHLQVKADER